MGWRFFMHKRRGIMMGEFPVPEPLNRAGVAPGDPLQDEVPQDAAPVVGDLDELPVDGV